MLMLAGLAPFAAAAPPSEALEVGPYSLRGSVLVGIPDFGVGVAFTVTPARTPWSFEVGGASALLANTVYGRIGARVPLDFGPRHLWALTPALGYRLFEFSFFGTMISSGPTATASFDWFHGQPELAFDLQLTLGVDVAVTSGGDDAWSVPFAAPELRLSYGVAF